MSKQAKERGFHTTVRNIPHTTIKSARDNPRAGKYTSVFGNSSGQSQETQQKCRQQGLLSSDLDRAVGVAYGVRASRGGPVAGSLDDVGIRSTINERSATFRLHLGGDITLANYGRETCLGDIVNLLIARGTKVDAVKGALVGADGGTDLAKLAGGQWTSNGLDTGKGLGDAEFVFVRGVGKTKGLPDRGVSRLNDGGNGRRLGVAKERLKVCGAAGGNVGDNGGKVIVGARPKCAESLQPGVDRADNGTAGPL